MLANLKSQLQAVINQSLKDSFKLSDNIPAVELEIPNDKQHGEFSCNIAMRLTRILKKNPMELAGTLQASIEARISGNSLAQKIKKVEVKKPGFINFYLQADAFYDVLYQVFKDKDNYGKSDSGKKQKVQIEFVSANPTGPLSVAHARQAAVGDSLGNILRFAGFDVTKEYYVNDEGNQINILGKSIELRGREILGESVEFPEDGYQGEYIKDIAQKFIDDNKITAASQLEEKGPAQYGVDHLLEIIKQELKDFSVEFDVWSHQSQIATQKNIEAVLTLLEKKKFSYEKDGALWFGSTQFGDDKDRVLRKSDGTYTYLTPDISYHKDKFQRGFDKVINIWGPDHHGYIPRIKASVQALGIDPDNLDVLIVQLATIYRGGKPMSMSTRKGQYISLREVIEEVGVDAARFFFLMRHLNAHLDFDLELAKKETPENPVYYIQYAHARINSIKRKVDEAGLKPVTTKISQLKEEEELDLIKKIGFFPDAIMICVKQLDPYAMAAYLQELATLFHRFYDKHRVLGEDPALSGERLGLIQAAQITFANGLNLLGLEAPERM